MEPRALQPKGLLRGLTPAMMAAVRAVSQEVFCDTGRVICEEGAEEDEAYLIVDGEVEVTQGQGAARRYIRRMGPGELLGELAILGDGRRTATATTTQPTHLRAIEREKFLALLAEYPGMYMVLLKALVVRLAQAEGELRSLREGGK